jgi:hypothetical protein
MNGRVALASVAIALAAIASASAEPDFAALRIGAGPNEAAALSAS